VARAPGVDPSARRTSGSAAGDVKSGKVGKWTTSHAHGSVHVGQRRAGHGKVGVDQLRGKVGRVLVIQIDDTLEDATVDDLGSVVGMLLLLRAIRVNNPAPILR